MSHIKEKLTISIEDYCVDFAEEMARAIEFRIEHDCLDAVENRLRQHGYVKERTCRIINGKCSNCGDKINAVDFAYCRCCGAKVVE